MRNSVFILVLAAASTASARAEEKKAAPEVAVFVEIRPEESGAKPRMEDGVLIAFADGKLRLEKDGVEVSIPKDRIARMCFYDRPEWWREESRVPRRPPFMERDGRGRDWPRRPPPNDGRPGDARPGMRPRPGDPEPPPPGRGDRFQNPRMRSGPDARGDTLRRRLQSLRSDWESSKKTPAQLQEDLGKLKAKLQSAPPDKTADVLLRAIALVSVIHKDDPAARRDAAHGLLRTAREKASGPGGQETGELLRMLFRDLQLNAPPPETDRDHERSGRRRPGFRGRPGN